MNRLYRILYIVGAFLIALFFLWELGPTDYVTVTFAAEMIAVFSCASGVLCIFVAWNLGREFDQITEAARQEARQRAEEAVREHVTHLESDLAAAREYIEKMEGNP